MSAKNELQEYFQKRKKPLPKYTTFRAGGNDHDPMWLSQVELCDGQVFASNPQQSKKQSELDAAQEAFNKLKMSGLKEDEGKASECYTFNFEDKKIQILVDVENRPSFIQDFIDSIKTSNIDIIGFISDGSTLQHKMKEGEASRDKRVKIVSVPSTRPDGADVGMAVYAGFILGGPTHSIVYIIVSEDHFAEALADCIRDYSAMLSIKPRPSCPKNLEVCVCRTLENVVDKLTNLKEYGRF